MDRPAHAPWTPERVIEAQRETIERLRKRAERAEKMLDAVALHGGRLQDRVDVLREILGAVADEEGT